LDYEKYIWNAPGIFSILIKCSFYILLFCSICQKIPLYFTFSIKHTNNNFPYVPNDDLGSAFIGEFEYKVKPKFEVVDVGSDVFYVNDFVSIVDTCAKLWFLEIDENLRKSTKERVEKVNMLKIVDKFFDERRKSWVY
jgi:hypothetical protein